MGQAERTNESGARESLAEGWVLEGAGEAGQTVRFVFSDEELTQSYLGISLGRHPALCDRVIADSAVSRRHFRIGIRGGALYVEDLNSLNGTYLDGRQLIPFRLSALTSGQSISVGRSVLRINRIGGAREPG